MDRRDNALHIEPSEMLLGYQVLTATDTRAAAICLFASLGAGGPTIIECASHFDRGYADLVPSLRKLGADIEKIDYPEKERRPARQEHSLQTERAAS